VLSLHSTESEVVSGMNWTIGEGEVGRNMILKDSIFMAKQSGMVQ
jgi:hypothetical protein